MLIVRYKYITIKIFLNQKVNENRDKKQSMACERLQMKMVTNRETDQH